MMRLRELQLSFQHCVVTGATAIESSLADSHGLRAAGRLDVYQQAHASRLVDALRESFPALNHTAGADQFDALARAYVAAQPSDTPSIRWYGRHFPAFLRKRAQDPHALVLADLARWEWTLAAAFDGPAAAAVDVDAVAGIDPGDWPNLRLALHPNLHRVRLTTNAVACWRAMNDGSTSPPAEVTTPSHWIAWRSAQVTRFRSLDRLENRAFASIRGGASFGEVCVVLAGRLRPESAALRAATLLKQWLNDGWVIGVTTAPA